MAYEMEIKASTSGGRSPTDWLCLHLLQQNFRGDVKKLKGSKNEYRVRVGDYRILFELVRGRIIVYDVGARKNIYK